MHHLVQVVVVVLLVSEEMVDLIMEELVVLVVSELHTL